MPPVTRVVPIGRRVATLGRVVPFLLAILFSKVSDLPSWLLEPSLSSVSAVISSSSCSLSSISSSSPSSGGGAGISPLSIL